MSTEPHTPQLVLTATVRSRLDSYNFREYLSAISVLFEILSDPEVDDIKKFDASGFPYPPGVIEFLADGWYVVYRVASNGDVQVSRMYRESDLPPRRL